MLHALRSPLQLMMLFLFSCASPVKDPMTQYIDELMAKMTLEEKIGQLNLPVSGTITTGEAGSSDIAKKIREGNVGGLFNIKTVEKIKALQRIAVEESRLKIPLLFGMDVIHGYETVFPVPLGLSCTWDTDLIEKSARIAATEATADGINWTFSPMVDIARDARWGRIVEGSGEDPYLGSLIAKAMVKGYQGDDLKKDNTLLSCVKHYAMYGAAEAGLDYNTADMSRQRMYNDYLPPYKAAVEAGVGSVMASFNEVDGVPVHANKWLLDDVLRQQWGFKGVLVSDYTGINEMVAHGLGDLKTVSARALNATLDMDMVGEGYLTTLKASLTEGKVTEEQINAACRRILEAKYQLGLFEDPYRYCKDARAKQDIFTAANRKEARAIAAESFVLLKNDGNILPLERKGRIALVGPLADNKVNMPGTWSVAANHAQSVSLLEGLQAAVGDKAKVFHCKGANLDEDTLFQQRATVFGKTIERDKRPAAAMLREAINIARRCDVIVAAVGEAAEMTGEASSRSQITIPETQRELLNALVKTGKPVVMVLFTGRPLAIKWESENVPAILNVWFGGTEAGNAIADVLFGDVNPSGRLTTTFPQHVGQLPMYYAHKNTGRPLGDAPWFGKFRSNYLDVSNDPVYPFGYGLGYAAFTYSDIRVNDTVLSGEKKLVATITVTNSGIRDGKETVQLYIRDLVGSVTRPVKELKGFNKVMIPAGQHKEVKFTVSTEELKFYNYDLHYDWEPGEFEIMIGPNARDVKKVKVTWNR